MECLNSSTTFSHFDISCTSANYLILTLISVSLITVIRKHQPHLQQLLLFQELVVGGGGGGCFYLFQCIGTSSLVKSFHIFEKCRSITYIVHIFVLQGCQVRNIYKAKPPTKNKDRYFLRYHALGIFI